MAERPPLAAAPAPAPADTPALVVGVPCAGCGYNLRGLRLDGRCPECGAEIAASIGAWQQRWRRALSPARRYLLFAGAALMLMLAVAAQTQRAFLDLVEEDGHYTTLVVLAWIALVLITTVSWDTGRRRWGGVPLAASIFATISMVLAIAHDTTFDVDMIYLQSVLIMLQVHIGVVATALLYIHIARVANRVGWRLISAQAIIVAVLLALAAAFTIVSRASAPFEPWFIPGVGGRGVFAVFLEEVRIVCRYGWATVDWFIGTWGARWMQWPLMLATAAAAVLMLQLALAAAFRAKPPKLHAGE